VTRAARADADYEKAWVASRYVKLIAPWLAVLGSTLLGTLANLRSHPQTPSQSAFIAFRADARHVIATIRVLDDLQDKQITEGLSTEPMARYGFRHFDAPASWVDKMRVDIRTARRWTIHSAQGTLYGGTAERIVGGYLQCSAAVGVLLTIDAPDSGAAFGADPTRYFVAKPVVRPDASGEESVLRVLPQSAITVDRRRFEVLFQEVLKHELPRVRAEAEPEIARMRTSDAPDHRAWAQEQQRIDDALASGRAQMKYDIQPVRLSPDAAVIYFARVEWTVGRYQAFAMSLWLKGEEQLETIDADLQPASWLRMWEFQRGIGREQLGQILNVFDVDGNGWGEILFARGGYESMGLSLLDYTRTGFTRTVVEYSYGC